MKNEKLASVHKTLLIAYLFLAIVFGLMLRIMADENPIVNGLAIAAIFGVPAVAHAIAMRGAKSGKIWGRNLSKVIGVLCLFGFPIWTIIGIYILKQTGKTWELETLSNG